MKKILSFFGIALLFIFFTSCNKKEEAKPDDGRYAIYELAKEKDFNGTYEEWLESIKGDKIVLAVIGNELKWKYSKDDDSTFKTLISLSTLKGADGKDGTNGTNGENGDDAKEVTDITSIKVGDMTIFTFTFDDGSEIKTELVERNETIIDVKSVSKEINAYKAFKYSKATSDYEVNLDEAEFQLGKYNFRFIENESLVPYISLEEASKLYNTNLNNNNSVSTVEEVDGNSVWTITTNNVCNVMVLIDPIEQEIVIDGSFDTIYKPATDNTKYSLFLGSQTRNEIVNKDEVKSKQVISYKNTDFKAFKDDGITYYPFGLINTFLAHYTGHRYFYNYTSLYEYTDLKNLTQFEIFNKKGDDEGFNIMSQMENYIDAHYKEKDPGDNPLMPLYLRYNNRSEFIFEFDNFYGLESVRNIKSMKDYFTNVGIYDDMIDDNSLIRGKAYALAGFILEDQHTGKGNTSRTPWGETNGGRNIEGAFQSKLVEERRALGSNLAESRKATLKANNLEDKKDAILYSADGLTAYFYFDSFEGLEYAYKSDGVTKLDDETLAKDDSYFFFVKQLTEIKNHVTNVNGTEVKVKNVVIDDSQNGGGYIYILGKLLALLSKDNKGYVYLRNELTNAITKTEYRVDSNKDGVFDENDSFGKDFDFFILTSNQSFSCGNAFPYIASQFDHVKIIGAKSGGGECVVDSSLVSNGIFYYHSSMEHLVIYNEKNKTYSGVEDGLSPDSTMLYSDFYNIEALNNVIKKLKNA